MASRDPAHIEVAGWLAEQVHNPAEFYGQVLRRSIDEVLDGPRTGRWDFGQLEKTEKTYVGTKIEIVLRAALGLHLGSSLDLDIQGHPVDIKWAMNSAWQIPREAVGELCLCLGGLRKLSQFQVGLVRCVPDNLNAGANRDGKRTLSRQGRDAMLRIVDATPLQPNFVATMDSAVRNSVMSEHTIQGRVSRLFLELPGTPIPRNAIRTVAQTEGDPMRRIRVDRHAGDPLAGMKILSAKYGNKVAVKLGYPPLGPDEFMAVPVDRIT